VGFDDFIGKPFLFEKICECMVRHLHVEFEHEPAPDESVVSGACAGNNATGPLPGDLRERLLAAASVNALTEIEALIGELKTLGPGPQCLAAELGSLLSSYDMDAVIERLNRIPAGE
jgi:hypothetical protein